jgi:hypothetical protein
MPYWNEILQITLSSPLPSLVSICLESWIPRDPSARVIAVFEIFLTPSLEIGVGEAKLVAIKTQCASASLPSTSAAEFRSGTTAPTLRITCSLDRELVAARQRGLWPLVQHRGNILKAAPSQRIDVPQEPDFPLLMHHSGPNDVHESSELMFGPSDFADEDFSNHLALWEKESIGF